MALTEQQYLAAWQAATQSADTPADFARLGGAAADDFAWVFVAGYQAAIRETFDLPAHSGWAAFAATEDKSGEKPGLTLNSGSLTGWKTWVAASDSIEWIITTLKTDGGRRYYRVPARAVSLHRRPGDDRFLGKMSQGFAEFDDVTDLEELSPGDVRGFGSAEARYVHEAYRAHVEAHVPTLTDMAADADIAALLRAHEAQIDEPNAAWLRDRRVIEMYLKR